MELKSKFPFYVLCKTNIITSTFWLFSDLGEKSYYLSSIML